MQVEARVEALEIIKPGGWARAKGFSYAIASRRNRTVYVAGQLAVRDGAASVDPKLSFAEQFGLALHNVVDVVKAAGGLSQDIAVLRVFTLDIEKFKKEQGAIATEWASSLGRHFPAMTLVQVEKLFCPFALIEIEAVAVVD